MFGQSNDIVDYFAVVFEQHDNHATAAPSNIVAWVEAVQISETVTQATYLGRIRTYTYVLVANELAQVWER